MIRAPSFVILTTVCLAPLTIRSEAQLIPFARFSAVFPGTVHYFNGGALIAQKIPVRFKYLSAPGVKGTPATGFDVQDALFSFTAVRLGPVDSLLEIGTQPLRLYSFSFTLETPLNGRSNLLSGTASRGDLRGLLGASSALFQSRTDRGAAISYTSDFLDFAPFEPAELDWILTGITPSLALSGSNFRAFNAGITGGFSYGTSPIASVPEGSSLALFGTILLPLTWALRRGVRRAR
jgi:hypothetical protein